MNNTKHEQLFTDLTPTQAEATTGGSPVDGPFRTPSSVTQYWGEAKAYISPRKGGGFTVNYLTVNDILADGKSVYAKFEAEATDGTHIVTSNKRYDKTGASGKGRTYRNLVGGGNYSIKRVRVTIYRDVGQGHGSDDVLSGNWITPN